MGNLSRRSFLAGSAVTAGLLGLAGCAVGGASLPKPESYPLDPDGDGAKAKWASEETRDGWTKVTNPDGAELGVMDASKLIQVDGLAFKDLNGNGKLDLYEDWRQPVDERAKALAEMLSAEECLQLMWHGGAADRNDPEDPDFGLLKKGSRAGVSRLSSNAESYASDIEWINKVQKICEESTYGIPYINSTDPYTTLDIPSTAGLAAAMDKDLWRKAGMWISRAWRATGARLELGPQIDLYTNPIVKRLNGAESEDPALARDFTQAFGAGMQSTWGDDDATQDKGWGSESVAVMLKHFVGAGAIETGCDDHNDQGKYDVFPGKNYEAHLIPFLDGGLHLDSTTEQMSAVMPNYGIPYSEDKEYGENVGGGFNKKQISILRNAGWDGMITTDWGIINSGRGTEKLSKAERYKLMLDAGVDQYGGGFEPTESGAEAYAAMEQEMGKDEALARVRESARRIFKVMMKIDLFEQPYSDRSVAKDVFESEAATKFSAEANEKCVIMLKNAGNVISKDGIGDKPRVYVPQMFTPSSKGFRGATSAKIASCFKEEVASEYFDVVTDAVAAPSGEPLEGKTEPEAQESDITRLTAEELAGVKYAVIEVQNPQDAFGGSKGGQSFGGGKAPDAPVEPVVFKPVSLQYRPYTADGASVKKVSLAGDTLEDGSKENRSHFGESSFAKNESSLDLVISTKAALPADAKLILIVNADHPMVFSEIEPYADVILMGWGGLTDESFARIITGAAEPFGLLPYQMPKDMDTVESQQEDVPRDMDCYTDSEGNTYDFAYGLNWSGVIDDERTKTYKANPLMKPETEVKADE